jgi:hypothetical protein
MNRQNVAAYIFMGDLAVSMVVGFLYDSGNFPLLVDHSKPAAISISGNLEPYPNDLCMVIMVVIIIVMVMSFSAMVTPPKTYED